MNLHEEITLTSYDVLRMTEDDFLRLSSIPNFGNITVTCGERTKTLSVALNQFNPELYEKFKLLLSEYSKTEEESEKENYDRIKNALTLSQATGNSKHIMDVFSVF